MSKYFLNKKKVIQRLKFFILSLYYFFFSHLSYSQNVISDKQYTQVPKGSSDNSYFFVPDSLKYLIPILDSIRKVDQQYRGEIRSLSTVKQESEWSIKNFENKSTDVKLNDSLNLLVISEILDKYGWLGTKDIGYFGMQTIFLVLQHADLATREKYLPMIRTAFQNKKLSPFYFALYEDRISLGKNQYQIYGTQFFYAKQLGRFFFFPILNPALVVDRHKNIGLEKLIYDDYLQSFNQTWNIEKYYSDSLLLVKKNIQPFFQKL